MTFLHYAEHILDVPGLRIVTIEVPCARERRAGLEGNEGSRYQRRRRASQLADRFFAQIVNAYLAKTQNRGGRVGHAHCFLFDAKGLLALALDEMRMVAVEARVRPAQQTFPGASSVKAYYQEYLGMMEPCRRPRPRRLTPCCTGR